MPALPKLSEGVKALASPEEQFSSMVESATGFTPPPGPMSALAAIMENVEEVAPELPFSLPELPKLPELKFPELPELPKLPELSKPTSSSPEVVLVTESEEPTLGGKTAEELKLIKKKKGRLVVEM